MTKRFNFTKRGLDNLPLPNTTQARGYYDTEIRALQLRITAHGSKTFYIRKKIHGISQRILVGAYPDLSIEQARKIALELCSAIAQGQNPHENKQRARAELKFRDLLDNYITGHAQVRCISWLEMKNVLRRYLSDWYDRQLTSIHKSDVQARLSLIGARNGRTASNHVLTYARAAINWCIANGLTKSTNPFVGVTKFRLQARERFLIPEELTRFFICLNEQDNQDLKDYVLISLFTGARRSNVLAMQWNQIDFDLKLWTIPRTKNGDSQSLPLTGLIIQILKERATKRTSPWVFPSTGKTGHFVEPKKPWQALLKAAKIENLRLHDLRRTLGSYMAIGNQSLTIISKALGHRSPTATQIYSRLTQDPVRQAMEKAQFDILAAAKIGSEIPYSAIVSPALQDSQVLDHIPDLV